MERNRPPEHGCTPRAPKAFPMGDPWGLSRESQRTGHGADAIDGRGVAGPGSFAIRILLASEGTPR